MFFSKRLYGHIEKKFGSHAKNLFQKDEFLHSLCHNDRNFFLENRTSYLKLSFQQGKKQFWNPCRNLLNRSPKSSFSGLEDDEKTQVFRKKSFPIKCSTGFVNCSYDNPAEMILTKSGQRFAQCLKMMIFLQKAILLQKVPLTVEEDNFDKLTEKILTKRSRFFTGLLKLKKKHFSKKISFLKIFWTYFVQIGKPRSLIFAKRPNVFPSISHKTTKIT